MSDLYAIACNVTKAGSAYRAGTKAYVSIITGGNSHLVVLKSRGGRWISIWVDRKHLDNFRDVVMVDSHPLRRSGANILLHSERRHARVNADNPEFCPGCCNDVQACQCTIETP